MLILFYAKFPRSSEFETDCQGTPIIPFLHGYPIKQTEGSHCPSHLGNITTLNKNASRIHTSRTENCYWCKLVGLEDFEFVKP